MTDTPAVTESQRAWEAATARFGDNPAHLQDKLAWYQGWMTESLRGRLIEALCRYYSDDSSQEVADLEALLDNLLMPIIEAELQNRDEEKARLVGEFRRLAAEALEIANYSGTITTHRFRYEGKNLAWEQAAQMLEESKP